MSAIAAASRSVNGTAATSVEAAAAREMRCGSGVKTATKATTSEMRRRCRSI